MAPERAPYLASRHGQPTKPIGKPFNGQAKGLFWLTWRSYAGPPQYYNSRGRKPSTRPGGVSRSRTEPWQPRAERPGGWLSPHARKGVSTFGNTGKHRPADWYLSRDDSLPAYTEILRFTQYSGHMSSLFFEEIYCFFLKKCNLNTPPGKLIFRIYSGVRSFYSNVTITLLSEYS